MRVIACVIAKDRAGLRKVVRIDERQPQVEPSVWNAFVVRVFFEKFSKGLGRQIPALLLVQPGGKTVVLRQSLGLRGQRTTCQNGQEHSHEDCDNERVPQQARPSTVAPRPAMRTALPKKGTGRLGRNSERPQSIQHRATLNVTCRRLKSARPANQGKTHSRLAFFAANRHNFEHSAG